MEFANFLTTTVLKNICKRLILKPAQISSRLPFFDNLHFWLNNFWYIKSCIIIYSFVFQLALTNIDTAIISSSHPVVFCKKRKVFLQISQNLQENTWAKDSFLMKLQNYRVYQKRDSGADIF